MSPVGGVGINLAGPLRAGRVRKRDLARVQVRRWIPTAILQALQRMIHAKVVAAAVAGDIADNKPSRGLRQRAGYLVAIGALSEHGPKYTLR